ncbi:hypothetical protein ASD11_14665 [Aeromicrobium sp. Root495]|uniref:SAF domain-containing protein n=1 Tax=Aeromicrobium sp. Root495 TaxID=1736550 RepID=UPI0006F21930|nr:SAF domain-containing protein [Aeromicrobium sp. Root495]KQY55752.1 hypothetical protein ASD11_14665 [Aeromicrobium sp. Root495]
MKLDEATTAVRGRRPAGTSLPTRGRLRGQALLGLLLVVGCALAGAVLFVNAGDRVTVLAATERIAAGRVIQRDEVTTKEVAGLDDTIAAEDVSNVVGKTASIDMLPGQVLSSTMLTDQAVPGPGEALAGLALNNAQMPGAGVEPGDTIRVLAVASADGSGGSSQPQVLADAARVYAVSRTSSGEASKVVTVLLPQADADQVTTYAAAGRVAIVKLTAGGR